MSILFEVMIVLLCTSRFCSDLWEVTCRMGGESGIEEKVQVFYLYDYLE